MTTIANQDRFIRHLKGLGLSAGYIRRIITIGKAAFNWAWKRQEITQPPHIQMPEKGRPRDRVLSLAETRKLIDASRRIPHLHRFVVLMFLTLARPRAILELTRFQVNIKTQRINLLPPGEQRTDKHHPTMPLVTALEPFIRHWSVGEYLVSGAAAW